MMKARPRIALAIGDPAGVGPELAARLVADSQLRRDVQLFVLGDLRVLRRGADVAGVDLDIAVVSPDDAIASELDGPVLVDLGHLDPDAVTLGRHSEIGGRFALDNFRYALGLGVAGQVGAVTFTPFNKAAMRMAHAAYDDEVAFLTEVMPGVGTISEFNILPTVWNARVSSHVPMSGVAALVTQDRIGEMLALTQSAMREAGIAAPRIAVAALNPHAGDSGNFGREEIDVIAPALAKAQAAGIQCEGPFPADTVFVRARKGEFDAVLTMYHDQGQIAMKLIDFDHGVTLLGGLAIPILTPAHGSAYDIAGKGLARVDASLAAMEIAARMALARAKAVPAEAMTFSQARALLT